MHKAVNKAKRKPVPCYCDERCIRKWNCTCPQRWAKPDIWEGW